MDFVDILGHLLSGRDNIGALYKEFGLSNFQNPLLRAVQAQFKAANSYISLNLVPNKQRQAVEKQDLDAAFHEQVTKWQFYQQAKERYPAGEEHLALMRGYFERIWENGEVPLPYFAKKPVINRNTLYLAEIRLTPGHVNALKEFLEQSRYLEMFWVKHLIINDCNLTDQGFALILEGLKLQGPRVQQISYSRNEIGMASLKALEELLPNIVDF